MRCGQLRLLDTPRAPGVLGPKPRVSSEMTVKVKSFYLFQERTRKVDLNILYENRQTENRTKQFITFISTLKFQGTYKKEAEGGSQCTLVCVVIVVGVCVSRCLVGRLE